MENTERRRYPKFKRFQVRWNERLGDPNNPYLVRWMIVFAGYSIRLHHWIGSDEKRAFHDHATDLISVVLKGNYDNVTPEKRFHVTAGRPWSAKAKQRHYLDIPREGAWTLLLCSRPYRKWGFWVDGKLIRPSRYFSKYKGHARNPPPT